MLGAGLVGVIANPAAGKDVRRLVSGATTVAHATKIGMVRRAVLGAAQAGAVGIVAMADAEGIAERASEGIDLPIQLVTRQGSGGRSDTVHAAAAMAFAGCRSVVVLGGDGTNRLVASAWPDAAIVPISTGTNNAFPVMVEATVAGMAAGLVASAAVSLEEAAMRSKVVRVSGPDGDSLALVDASLVDGRFVGSGAVWDPTTIRLIIAAVAEPQAVGMSAVAGLLAPCARHAEGGVAVWLDPSAMTRLRAPLAPGLFAEFGVAKVRRLASGEEVTISGPGVMALDGERELVLQQSEVIRVAIRRDGPWVVDIGVVLRLAAERGVFVTATKGVSRAG